MKGDWLVKRKDYGGWCGRAIGKNLVFVKGVGPCLVINSGLQR